MDSGTVYSGSDLREWGAKQAVRQWTEARCELNALVWALAAARMDEDLADAKRALAILDGLSVTRSYWPVTR